MPRLAPFAILVILIACGGDPARRPDVSGADSVAPVPDSTMKRDTQSKAPEPVRIATDLRSYRAGDPVELRITNTTATTYTFNPCMRVIQQQTGDAASWAEIKEERICTMIAHMLEPNATRSERTELGEALKPGTYRLMIRFTPDSPGARGSVAAYTAPITVTP